MAAAGAPCGPNFFVVLACNNLVLACNEGQTLLSLLANSGRAPHCYKVHAATVAHYRGVIVTFRARVFPGAQ